MLTEWCLLQPSSERLPPVADRTGCRGPQSDNMWRESEFKISVLSINSEVNQGRGGRKTLGAKGDRGHQENMVHWFKLAGLTWVCWDWTGKDSAFVGFTSISVMAVSLVSLYDPLLCVLMYFWLFCLFLRLFSSCWVVFLSRIHMRDFSLSFCILFLPLTLGRLLFSEWRVSESGGE